MVEIVDKKKNRENFINKIWESLILNEIELEENGYVAKNSKYLVDLENNVKVYRNSNESKLDWSKVEKKNKILAMDNEMVRTKTGLELSRITIINFEGEVLYDQLVKPENEILDYNTKFSGMTYELLKDVTKNLK